MNKLLVILFAATIYFTGCKEKSHEKEMHHEHGTASDAVDVSENQLLYDEVMKIHDEVMPKMEDIHKKKNELKTELAAAPTPEQKQIIEQKIARLDSAGESMMIWMRQFNPVPDSEGEEKAREYLEGEMEKIKAVRERMINALQSVEE